MLQKMPKMFGKVLNEMLTVDQHNLDSKELQISFDFSCFSPRKKLENAMSANQDEPTDRSGKKICSGQGGREKKFLIPVLSFGLCPRWRIPY
jgi:hypothetical protein